MKLLKTLIVLTIAHCAVHADETTASDNRPNILFCIADDMGWPHAGNYGDTVVKTPTFNRIAKQGMLFEHAYISAPSCTPSRNAILTGKYHWQLGQGVNLWSEFPAEHATYPRILEKMATSLDHTVKHLVPDRICPSQ